MGRRDADTAAGIDTPASVKAWDTVRRALGRLVGHVQVQEVAAPERVIPAEVRLGDLTLPPPGLPEKSVWRPSAADVRLASLPSAATGLRESDLLPSVRSALNDCAIGPPPVCAMTVARAEAGRIESAGLAWEAGVTRLPDAFMRLPALPVRVSVAALLPTPKAHPLRTARLSAPPIKFLRPPRPPSPRILWASDAVLGRMALTRRGRDAPPDSPPGPAFAAERRRLAEATGLPLEEVTLLGVYPGIPILAVRRIVVDEEGDLLRLWLKPEVLRARTAPHLITLLVGRQSRTGKMLQAAL